MKEKMTTVLLPRGRKQEENFVIVSVNGRSWKIMRGVEVRVPVCVAEVLENAAMMAEVAEWPDEIDRNRAKEAEQRAERRLQAHDPSINISRAELALKRALVRQQLADK